MNGSIITREVRSDIWQVLRPLGFILFTARTAWRYSEEKIDIVNVQSSTADIARGLGVTSFSFSINLSCYLTYIPPTHAPRLDKGRIAPHEAECFFRHRVVRGLNQPDNPHKDVWAIDTAGENLPWCIDDARQQLLADLEWFDRMSSPNQVLSSLLDNLGQSEIGTYFNNPSPFHSYVTGYAALRCGDDAIANDYLARAIATNSFPHFFNSVEGARYRSKYGHRAP